jgi:hypothetical protein
VVKYLFQPLPGHAGEPIPLRFSCVRACGSEPSVENGRQHAVVV